MSTKQLDWHAEAVDGECFPKSLFLSIDKLPIERISRLVVETGDVHMPTIALLVDVAAGERLHHFTRRCMKRITGQPVQNLSMLVFEVRLLPKSFVRLYLHPTEGPILTTRDLYL